MPVATRAISRSRSVSTSTSPGAAAGPGSFSVRNRAISPRVAAGDSKVSPRATVRIASTSTSGRDPLPRNPLAPRAQRFEDVLVDLERGQDQGLDAGQIFVGGHLPAHLAIEPAPKTPVLPVPISLARDPDPKV